MRILLDRGTNPLIVSRDGTTILMEAMGVVGDVDRRGRRTAFRWAPGTEEPATMEVARLALELGVDVNAVSHAGNTAAHGAAKKGFNTVLQFLADNGAILDVKNKKGETPLTLAEKLPEAEDGGETTAQLLRRLAAGQ
ncbi:MAG: hypothetical protein GWN58_43765 [Anaerolineae bacterium]|nr:hypothetical protein [Anaerolineae bacterium]